MGELQGSRNRNQWWEDAEVRRGPTPSAGEELRIPGGLGGILMEDPEIPRILMEKLRISGGFDRLLLEELGIPGGFTVILLEKPRIPIGFARILTEELGILHWAWHWGGI